MFRRLNGLVPIVDAPSSVSLSGASSVGSGSVSVETIGGGGGGEANARALYGRVVSYMQLTGLGAPGEEGIAVKLLVKAIFHGLGSAAPGIPSGQWMGRVERMT